MIRDKGIKAVSSLGNEARGSLSNIDGCAKWNDSTEPAKILLLSIFIFFIIIFYIYILHVLNTYIFRFPVNNVILQTRHLYNQNNSFKKTHTHIYIQVPR